MWAEDRASKWLGMTLVDVGDGAATLSLTVREEMTNGHGIAHGGFIFTLADSAFALACNSTGNAAVAAHCQISFLEPVHVGDTLTAAADSDQRLVVAVPGGSGTATWTGPVEAAGSVTTITPVAAGTIVDGVIDTGPDDLIGRSFGLVVLGCTAG